MKVLRRRVPQQDSFAMAVDPAFKVINANSTAFLIWRIENLQLVAVPTDQYGTFYEGDSYIVYAASEYGRYIGVGSRCGEVRGSLETHIHFWLGAETSQDESAVAAYKSVELDGLLAGLSIQHREIQGSESSRFRAYFKNGLRILKGGVASGLQRVTGTAVEPRLFRVKGRRQPTVTQMPAVSWEYFNSGDVFIVDTKDVVFVWVGRSANGMEKIQATKVAVQLRDEHNAVSVVFVDDGKETELTDSERVLLGVYLDLSPQARRAVKASSDDDHRSEQRQRSALKLYQCSDQDGTYKVIELKAGPLMQEDLNSNDSFIIDNGANGIWVWVGRNASAKERIEAMRNAHGFVKKKNYPSHTHVSRVVDGGEPAEFKVLFISWKDKDTTVGINKTHSVGRVAKPVSPNLDSSTLHRNPQLAAESQLVDDGSGERTVWRISHTKLVEVPQSAHGVFYAGDCYLVKYTYSAVGRNCTVLYYWLGLHSNVTEQTALALHTVAQDDVLGGSAVQVRVVQGKEPPQFLAIFHGKMVTLKGEHSSSLPTEFLLQVSGNKKHNTRATQVELKAFSLNSNDVFVLCTGANCFVWCGKGSTGDEREMAKTIAHNFAQQEYTVIFEGQEKKDFWDAIGGVGQYANDKRLAVVDDLLPARLFQCSNASGTFRVEEITNFNQSDLIPEDVMLLDTRSAIFLWIGKQANKEERIQATQLAIEYLQTDPGGRDLGTPIIKIKQGFEPPNFTGFFGAWDLELWNNHKTFEDVRLELEGQKPELQVELKLQNGTQDFEECDKFAVEKLLQKDPENLPPAVDPLHKEVHLSHADFEKVFGVTYSQFSSLPKWRQDNLKKTAGLF